MRAAKVTMIVQAVIDILQRFVVTCILLFLILPMIAITIGSFGDSWFGTILPSGYTVRWYQELLSPGIYRDALIRSLIIAFIAVVLSAAIAVPTVYAVYFSESERLKRVFDYVLVIPIAIPPLVIAIGTLQSFDTAWFGPNGAWYLIVAGHLVLTLPFMLSSVMVNMESIDYQRMEEAADSLGASGYHKTVKILLPNLVPGIISGSLMVFARSLSEYEFSLFLSTFQMRTFPVILYEAFQRETGFTSAATAVIIYATMLSILGLMLLSERRGWKPQL